MFRCELCQALVGPGVACSMIVLETRSITYPVRERAKKRPRYERRLDRKKSAWIPDPGGTGREIVKESRACPTCREMSELYSTTGATN